ncbi:MAG TPA: PhaM family polyhydroxyalkanoate granule multifunctional regulatory protein [Paraburkholderia sp.]|uniref:PhaM family polyhydroxyalkanoate granule multifunctional regulatory protein n=1 Tax=Paraburkholderia sp. TaxID=1926495 RepID=UPI002B46E0C6|nr:PhaM family polyhydroxyalkanoate granule multifunctional regulatory protein [Paraburkholderia sp.]HKR44003.1 PhaM family polyhydroxyalkanoate granule multifunctional regulatory protein [Paraburkholderia sp.]
MTDSAGTMPPFPGFPGFPPAEMLDQMWGMMRLTPFGGAFPGGEPGVAQAFGPPLSMMSDMMTPLTNIEELDKRITDLRAVEQWLKLNLGMLQSAIQALEVQRATLTTLRAFGAFAQAQMTPTHAESEAPRAGAARERAAEPEAANAGAAPEGAAAAPPGFDAGSWWNLVQAQFNQLAQFAMAQPAAAAQAAQAAAEAVSEAQAKTEAATVKRSSTAKRSGGSTGGNGNSNSGGAGRSAPRGAKKAPAQPE